jgi:hypothetical protein
MWVPVASACAAGLGRTVGVRILAVSLESTVLEPVDSLSYDRLHGERRLQPRPGGRTLGVDPLVSTLRRALRLLRRQSCHHR